MDDHPIIRRYANSAQALGDIAVLESEGISSYLIGADTGTTTVMMQGSVCLCVEPDNIARAGELLRVADKERFEANVPAEKRKKTFGRYVKIGAGVYVICFVAGVIQFRGSPPDIMGAVYVAAGLALAPTICIAGACALLDI